VTALLRRLLSLGRGNSAAPPRIGREAAITLRLARQDERPAIEQLAELSGGPAPSGPCLVAEVDGQLWAVLPLAAGPILTNPFRPAAELGPLLAVRAAQLAASEPERGWSKSARRVPRTGRGRASEDGRKAFSRA
jgi:hypothetical protein